MGKLTQKQRKHRQKNNQAKTNADTDQNDDQPVCWICYAKLTKKNTERLGCGHHDYCKSCIQKWANDKDKPFTLIACAENKSKKNEPNALTFFNGERSFSCPTCRVKHTFIWPSIGKNDELYPKQIIAYLKFADKLNRNPMSYITDKEDLQAHVPQQFKHRMRINKKIQTIMDPVWVLITKAIGKEIDAGETEFYWKKCCCDPDCDVVFLTSSKMKPMAQLININDIIESLGIKMNTDPAVFHDVVIPISLMIHEHFNPKNSIDLDIAELPKYF